MEIIYGLICVIGLFVIDAPDGRKGFHQVIDFVLEAELPNRSLKEKRAKFRKETRGWNHVKGAGEIYDPYGTIVKHTMKECRQLEYDCSERYGEEKFRFLDSHKTFPDCECKW